MNMEGQGLMTIQRQKKNYGRTIQKLPGSVLSSPPHSLLMTNEVGPNTGPETKQKSSIIIKNDQTQA